ncbi:hypothetical protein EFS54_01530 [Periweissella beninensis]|nr:hypothetical protein [Periweissella beninensis]
MYNKDEKSVNKKYTHYNIPSSYAYMLTSKDTVPRVYYGDLYTDNGQYMETQTPYFKAISNLLKLRVKYVSGGETQNVDGNDILTQVRFGNGAMKVTDKGTRATRTQGVGVIIANNPKLILKKGQTVVLHMGAAHKNQLFRAAVLTTKNGLKVYASDQNAPTMRTNSKGDLIFNSSSIYGVAQVEVSGYLAVWVPVGASEKQDARTKATQAKNKDGQVLHSNAALDSNLIYEGFSNFQAFASKKSEYTNVKIAKNAQLFKSWGVTSFQLAPQYKSSTDTSFLDSIIANGYAFTDRYNVGQDGATKYGDLDDLVNAIKALHGSGIQVMADFVPDQIYNLPNQQVVAVNRTNATGDVDQNSDLQNVLYASNTQSSGKDYQSIYGGAFLTKIKKLYPDLFTNKQVSTGKSIDASQVIKQWEAKYFNGSNVQGKGIGYVLKDSATGQYFKVTANSAETAFLPLQLTNELSNTGFYSDSTGIAYYDTSGYRAKNAFIEGVNGNWYYFDKDGYMIFGSHKIKENYYYFLPNGHELRSSFLTDEKNNTYYYNAKGKRVVNQYVSDDQGNYYYFGSNGKMVQGLVVINDSYHNTQYFYVSGIQAKDAFIKDKKGNIRYFDRGSGNMLVAQFKQTPAGKWMYFKNNGVAAKGYLKLGNTTYYFDQNGFQKKDYYTGKFYFDKKLGKKVVSSYVYTNKLTSKHQYHWYYLNAQGVAKVLKPVTKKELVNVKNNARQVKVSRDNLNKLLQKLTQNSVKNHKKIKLTKQQLSKFKLKYQRLVHQNKILNKLYKINTTKLTLKNTNRLAKISKKKLDTLAKKIKQEQKSLRNLTSKAKKAKLRLVIKKNQKVFQKERKVYVRLKQKAVRVRLMPVISDYW